MFLSAVFFSSFLSAVVVGEPYANVYMYERVRYLTENTWKHNM